MLINECAGYLTMYMHIKHQIVHLKYIHFLVNYIEIKLRKNADIKTSPDKQKLGGLLILFLPYKKC